MGDAVRIVLSGAPVSVGVLRIILDRANSSEDWMSLCKVKIIPALMRILEEYRRESPILKGEKGILCLQLLSLSFQVAFMAFQDDPFSFANLSPLDPSLKLTDHVLSILTPQIQRSEEVVHSTGIPQRMIMPWLSSEHAGQLLEYLYRERFRFLQDRSDHPDHWTGFSILLYGIWAHMRGLGSSLNPGLLGPRLIDVACRFVAVAPENKNEDILATTIIYTMRNISAMFGAAHPFPKLTDYRNPGVEVITDAISVVRCYILRLSHDPPDLKLYFHLYEWTRGSVHANMPDLMLSFFRFSYVGVWSILDPTKESRPITADRVCDLIDYAGQLMGFTGTILEDPHLTPNNKDALLAIVYQSDIFALLARILLLPLALDASTLTPRDKRNLNELYESLRIQLHEFGNILQTSSSSSSQLFRRSYPDWLKAVYCFQELCFMSKRDAPMYHHIANSMRSWIGAGFTVFKSEPNPEPTIVQSVGLQEMVACVINYNGLVIRIALHIYSNKRILGTVDVVFAFSGAS
ncbi:hypothetical protein FRC12_012646 [Ceratobasidium sp. 428]|nr:hypothetical protein FRC12_012646 [Ceratobasidium sp. 428]